MAQEIQPQLATKENLRLLIDGKLPWEEVKKLMRKSPKEERFWNYLAALQERVPWKDKILMRISDCLYIVQKEGGGRVVKCDCGYEFGDYRANWKLECLVYVRKTPEEVAEIYTVEPILPDTNLVELREFYCPACLAMLATEIVPVGYPPVFEILPDLDAFYRDWMGKPLSDENPDWFQDKTIDKVSQWVEK